MYSLTEEEQRGRDYESVHWAPTEEERVAIGGALPPAAAPLTAAEIAEMRAWVAEQGDDLLVPGKRWIPAVNMARFISTIDARDKTIAERDAEIARLRERIAKAAVYAAAHHAYRAILDAPPRARIHAQPIDERRANLEIVRAREKAHVDMIAAFDQD